MILASVELPILIVYALMVVGFIVMVWGIKNLNRDSKGRIFMIAGIVLVFGSVIGRALISPEKSEDKRLEKNSRLILSAKAERAADYIVNRFQENGATVAFLIDDESNSNPDSDIHFVLEELQRRLEEKGGSWTEVLTVGLMGTDKKTGEERREDPTDAAIMKKKLDEVYDKVDIVVNFVGLPGSISDLKKITFLTKKNTATGKNNMLLMSDIGLPYVEQDMLKKNRVCAIVDYISGDVPDLQKESVPKDLYETFDMFFFFLDGDTLSNFIDENPSYFISK